MCAAVLLVGSFGCSNSAKSGGLSSVVINEVVTSNKKSHVSERFGSPDWVELYNTSDTAIDISGCCLSDNTLEPRRFSFPEGTVIAAHEYLVVYCIPDAADVPEGVYVANFGLSRTGESLLFTDEYTQVIQYLEIPELRSDVSYARYDNGEYGYSASTTFGLANTGIVATLNEATVNIEPLDALRFTEIVNGSAGWVELQNITDEAVLLSQYTLSDNPTDVNKWQFPGVTLEAGGYVVVELCGVDEDETLNASFKVNSKENAIYLYNNVRQLTDTLTFELGMPDGVSAVVTDAGVRYTSHITKGQPNSSDTFASLEWTEMDDSDAVRINEFLPENKYSIIDAEGDRSEWVELWNSTDTAVSLLGYYLSDNRSNPYKWALPDVEIPANGYTLVFLSGKDCTEGELHASFRISSVDEGIFLFTNNGMRMDSLLIPEGLNDNVSIGRGADGNILYYAAPTPNAQNTTYGFTTPIGVGGFNADSIYISEVSGVAAARSGNLDWVELYNASGTSQNLAGWYITDDPDEPQKFSLANVTVYAGGYAVIYCTDASDEITAATAPFNISGSGETLYLVAPDGGFCDVFQTGVTGAAITSGRENGSRSGARVFFAAATRGAANGSPLSGYTAEPVFSVTQLYCTSAFSLELSCATQGAVIHYTTDGSAPTASSKVYNGAVSITGNTVVRAIAVCDGLVNSPSVTRTYLFNDQHTVPVFCLSLSTADFQRMYTASMSETGGVTKGAEVACFMEYYVDGKLATYTGAGVRVSGASTALYAQKSLGLYFRAGYGNSKVVFPFFDGCDVTTFRSIVLRNAGQDANYARIRDAYISRLCQGLNLDVAYVEPVAVYINGQYWGLYDLKQNINEDFFASNYGIDRNTIDIIKRNRMLLAGDRTEWLRLRNYCVSYNFSNDANYEQLCQWVDVDSIMDYIAVRTYFYDGDMFNQKYWRAQDYSVKWRAILYDSDFAMNGNTPSSNLLPAYFNPNGVSAAHGSITNMDIYCAVNQNQSWRDAFIVRYIYLIKYVFEPDNALTIFDELYSEIEPEMPRHISRWSTQIKSYSAWSQEISALRSCIANRQSYALRYLRQQYGLTAEQFAVYEQQADALAAG